MNKPAGPSPPLFFWLNQLRDGNQFAAISLTRQLHQEQLSPESIGLTRAELIAALRYVVAFWITRHTIFDREDQLDLFNTWGYSDDELGVTKALRTGIKTVCADYDRADVAVLRQGHPDDWEDQLDSLRRLVERLEHSRTTFETLQIAATDPQLWYNRVITTVAKLAQLGDPTAIETLVAEDDGLGVHQGKIIRQFDAQTAGMKADNFARLLAQAHNAAEVLMAATEVVAELEQGFNEPP